MGTTRLKNTFIVYCRFDYNVLDVDHVFANQSHNLVANSQHAAR